MCEKQRGGDDYGRGRDGKRSRSRIERMTRWEKVVDDQKEVRK